MYFSKNFDILGRILHDFKAKLVGQYFYNRILSTNEVVYYNNYSSIQGTNPNLYFFEIVLSIK